MARHHAASTASPSSISGESITIDTGIVYIGAPIGTDTTGQGAEGPPCVGG